MDYKTFFKQNSLFFSRLGIENDPARFDANGKLIEFRQDYEKYADLHAKMQNNGVRVHTSILFCGWVGPDTYDYTLTDDTLKALFDKVPDALYLPRVKLNPPVNWQKEHPEELFVYYGGNNDPEYIRPKVGTLEHDLLGGDSETGYWLDKRRNVGGMFSNQSFSSDAWVEDGKKALIALMRHIAESPYADRIIGYHVAYGGCGETCWWGRCCSRHGDYSRVFERGFLEWGTKKYGSLQACLDKWGTTELPPPEQLILKNPENTDAFLRRRPEDLICIDRDIYVSGRNASVAETFCRTVKEENPEMLTGVFYGYILECSNANYTGWLDFDTLLNSPYVDFMAAPCSYFRRNEGDSGGYIVPAESVNRRKMFMDELDIRTYLAMQTYVPGMHAIPKECTRAVFCREAAKNLESGSGFWWMDLGGTWYDSDYVRDEIRYVEEVAAKVRAQKQESKADILQVVSEESFLRHTESEDLFSAHKNAERELALAGGIFETYRLSDLPELDLSRYKLIILRDCVAISDEIQQLLNNFKGVILCSYLDGMAEISLPGRNPVSGIEFAETEEKYPAGDVNFEEFITGKTEIKEFALPRIVPTEKNLKVYARFADGSPAMVSRDGKRFHAMLPVLEWKQFRALLEYAECKTYGEAPCVVYGNTAFTAVFSHNEPEKFTFEIY